MNLYWFLFGGCNDFQIRQNCPLGEQKKDVCVVGCDK